MKRFLWVFGVVLLVSCNSEEELQFDEKEAIDAYIETKTEAGDPVPELTTEGVYVSYYANYEGYEIKEGDSIGFYYAAKLFNTSSYFDTNIESEYEKFGISADDRNFDPVRVRYLKDELYPLGLEYGIKYATLLDVISIIIPFDLGYGDQQIGFVPAYSTLDFEVFLVEHTSDKIKSELAEIDAYINAEYILHDKLKAFYKKTIQEGKEDVVLENDTVFVKFSYKLTDGTVLEESSGLANKEIVANFDGNTYNKGFIKSLIGAKDSSINEFVIPSYLLDKSIGDYKPEDFVPVILNLEIDSIKK